MAPAKAPAPGKAPAPEAGADPLLGKPAPDVPLRDQDDQPFRLSDLRGQRVILYFYPKDMTPGCTTQACDFQAMLPDFTGAGARIVGVSPDDAASHRKFRAKHDLQFTLAFDPTGKVLEAFGVWKEKTNYGRTTMGVERSTFLLDEQGIVRGVWRKVKAEGHAAMLLGELKG